MGVATINIDVSGMSVQVVGSSVALLESRGPVTQVEALLNFDDVVGLREFARDLLERTEDAAVDRPHRERGYSHPTPPEELLSGDVTAEGIRVS